MKFQNFREALSTFPTGVTVVTTTYNNKYFGLTINSFTSLSLSPPLILFCISKNFSGINIFINIRYLAVSILSENQINISKHFAKSQVNKFDNILYHLGLNGGCPLINGAICYIECKKFNQYDGGDHIIIIGQVIHSIVNKNFKPLVYCLKQYMALN